VVKTADGAAVRVLSRQKFQQAIGRGSHKHDPLLVQMLRTSPLTKRTMTLNSRLASQTLRPLLTDNVLAHCVPYRFRTGTGLKALGIRLTSCPMSVTCTWPLTRVGMWYRFLEPFHIKPLRHRDIQHFVLVRGRGLPDNVPWQTAQPSVRDLARRGTLGCPTTPCMRSRHMATVAHVPLPSTKQSGICFTRL
jgi:hypothetical protein